MLAVVRVEARVRDADRVDALLLSLLLHLLQLPLALLHLLKVLRSWMMLFLLFLQLQLLLHTHICIHIHHPMHLIHTPLLRLLLWLPLRLLLRLEVHRRVGKHEVLLVPVRVWLHLVLMSRSVVVNRGGSMVRWVIRLGEHGEFRVGVYG